MQVPLEWHRIADRLDIEFPRVAMPRVHRVGDQPRRLGIADGAHAGNAGVGPFGFALAQGLKQRVVR